MKAQKLISLAVEPDSKQTLLIFNNRTDVTEQKSNVDAPNKSPASKRRKSHSASSDDKIQHVTTTSDTSLELDVVLNGLEPPSYQQLTAVDQQSSKNGSETHNFILPSEEDCLAPEENLEPNSAALERPRTRGVWHKSLGENHLAQVKERSLLGHIMCSEEAKKDARIGYLPYSKI